MVIVMWSNLCIHDTGDLEQSLLPTVSLQLIGGLYSPSRIFREKSGSWCAHILPN